MILLPEQIEALNHISDNEIRQDIGDTEKEIAQYESELQVLRCNPAGNRTEIYLREGRIASRRDFIRKLNQILDYRHPNN